MVGSGMVGVVGIIAPPPAAPAAGFGFIIAVGVVVGVGFDAGVVPLMEAGVVVIGVVGNAVLPAAPVAGVVGVIPVVTGVVGVVGVVATGAGVIASLPQPESAAMMQSVESVASLVIMESSNFELTHISPKTALPLRNPPGRTSRAPIRVSGVPSPTTPARFVHSYTLL
jgi:hypothetical protein